MGNTILAEATWNLVATVNTQVTPKAEQVTWNLVATVSAQVTPKAEQVTWNLVATVSAQVTPKAEQVTWNLVATANTSVKPKGEAPPQECSVDSDCPEGYVCVNGKCVLKEEAEKGFPWIPVALAGGVAIVVIAATQKGKGKKKA